MTTLPLVDTDEDKRKDASDEGSELVREGLKLYDDWRLRELPNIEAGYDDLEFRAGNQWPIDVLQQRVAEGRPCQTINQMGQYVRQVTGDMRQMRPAIKVVPIDDNGDEERAEAMGGVIRYIENRSDAPGVYFQGADSQVTCGIGAWRVTTEYASDTTFNQEIRIAPIEDAIAVVWDLDAVLPTKEDAMKCLVPFDISRDKFKAMFPKAVAEDFAPTGLLGSLGHLDWSTTETVRIGEYWYKKATKKTLALMPDGAIEDCTDNKERAAELTKLGGRVEKRDGFKVYRCLMTAKEVLEGPDEWQGSYIPIVPVIGEEIRIGRRLVRHGVVRFAKDPQRTYNYMSSAETEVVALQPKAPFIGTEKNFEQYQDIWESANRTNHPYLPYTPDPANGNAAPSRVAPAVASQGITEGIQRAARDIQAVIGIYNASLGAASNETSGKAVIARQREGDTGTFVYIDNWSRAIRYTGKILVDLIPKIYDTARVLRIVGEDGKTETIEINQVGGMDADGVTPLIWNDVTTGAYDVALQMGPSYTTKREEARDGMRELIQAQPALFPAIGDLYVKAQDWPMADDIADRLRMLAPPPIRAQIEAESKKPMPQPQPDPAQVQAAQMEMATKQAEVVQKEAQARKAVADADKAEIELEQMRIAPLVEAMKPPAPAPQPQQTQQPDHAPVIENMARAIVELQHAVSQIVQTIQQPPPMPQEMPPDMLPQGIPMEQPPPQQGGFFNGA